MSADPNLWDNQEKAQKLMSEKNTLEASLDAYDGYVRSLDDYAEMVEFAESENDEVMLEELQTNLDELQATVKHAELEALLSGEADANDTYLEVHAGSGGTEAMDWAQMLLRMYTRWAETHHYKVEYIEETEGEVAGLKSATIKISGHNAYGWLKSESGVHRLVRISPFDSAARRHTSFASIGVYPVIDDNIQIEINEADCRIDTYRASGACGQHINKTDSAVRITHIPTGIVVQCQDDRSQFKNKEKAMNHLRARLYDSQKSAIDASYSEKRKLQVGSGDRSERIRTYNYPQGRVTDHRINLTLYKLDEVVSGEALGEIIDALIAEDQADRLAEMD